MRSGLILFAHGARDPLWARPFEAVAVQVRLQRPKVAVRLAYLEFMSPALPAAGAGLIEEGCGRIDVVPLFLGAGGHVRRDLPLLIEALQREYPGVAFRLHPAVGETEPVVRAMADAAVSALTAAPCSPLAPAPAGAGAGAGAAAAATPADPPR